MWIFIPVIKASLLQSSASHDPSEITLIWGSDAQETFMIIINSYFCGYRDLFLFDAVKVHRIGIILYLYCQFNASLLYKTLFTFKQ